MADIITIQNVRGYEKDGTVYLNIEDTARGLGFVHNEIKNGVEYSTVRWATVNQYLQDFGFANKVAKDDFIPENIFYRLAMKAKNEVAEKFQAKVADEILPAIRKHGAYFKNGDLLKNPYAIMELCRNWIAEREEKERLQEIVSIQSVQIEEMRPKASYYDLILQSKEAIPVGVIAKDYGMSGKAMNQLLHKLEIQYRCAGTWLVYQNYAAKGYTVTKTIPINDELSKTHTNWTQKGRLFLYEKLKQHGHLPLIEQTEDLADES